MSVETFLCRRSSLLVPVKCQEQVLHIPCPRSLLKSQCQGSSPPNALQPSDGQFGPGSCTSKGKHEPGTGNPLVSCQYNVQCYALYPIFIFFILYLYMCKLQMFVLSFSHEAVRSMFHTQMRWVGLESIILLRYPVPLMPCVSWKRCKDPKGLPLFTPNSTFPVF